MASKKPYLCSDPNEYKWGIGGLTDGDWGANGVHCFASGDKDAFPKTVVVDLQQPQSVGSVLLGVPGFGSTKTIQVSVSADGTTYSDVGIHVFEAAKEARYRYVFPATQTRYIKLTYPDHYAEMHDFPPTFVFTEELEAYGSAQ